MVCCSEAYRYHGFYRLLGLGATTSSFFSPPQSMLSWVLHCFMCHMSHWHLKSLPREVFIMIMR